jgi:CubicO group peptidase (beta-lactamase class C family)
MRFPRRTLIVLSIVLLAARTAAADAVDDLVRAEMDKQRIPGLSLAVVRDGKVVKEAGYGHANVELQVPATLETMYQLASVTKQFIAAAIMMLAQEGKLGIDDPVSMHVEGTPESWKDITLRHLLTHTSGIVRDDGAGFRGFLTEEGVLKEIAGKKLEFAPGEKWAYSNAGFNMLALVIRKRGGQRWDEFLQERIFTPLEMKATRRYSPAAIIPNRASGYLMVDNVLQNAPATPRSLASGGLVTNVRDLAKWDAALYTDKFLKPASLEQMWTPVKLKNGTSIVAQGGGYGFGWSIRIVKQHRLVGHGGSRPGFSTFFARFVDDRLTVILLSNRDAARLPPLVEKIAAHYIPSLQP